MLISAIQKNTILSVILKIDQAIREGTDVSGVYDMSQYSRVHLCRLFKQMTGCTIASYIRREKIHHAQRALRNDRYSIIDVAILSGFSSHQDFCRVFKNQTGQTPSEYRRENLRPYVALLHPH